MEHFSTAHSTIFMHHSKSFDAFSGFEIRNILSAYFKWGINRKNKRREEDFSRYFYFFFGIAPTLCVGYLYRTER